VRVAFNGDAFVVAWSDDSQAIRIARVAPGEGTADGDGVIVGSGSVVDLDAAGSETLLLYTPIGMEGGAPELRGMRIGLDGAALDPAGFAVAPATDAAAASAGNAAWLVVFDDDDAPLKGRFVGTPEIADAGATGAQAPSRCPEGGLPAFDAGAPILDAATAEDVSPPLALDAAVGDGAATEPVDAASRSDSVSSDVRLKPVTRGGCDCSMARDRSASAYAPLALIALASLAWRRKRPDSG
jgi:MYXO-CTERM domain-containing protein